MQEGIWYSEEIEFMLFDIVSIPKEDQPFFQSYAVLQKLAEKHGLLYARPLKIGKLSDVVVWVLARTSLIFLKELVRLFL